MKDSLPANRLGLARWLVDRDNPLMARVQVNRLWEQLFGRGLVETSEDFGTQGQPPSHPELLDWLAVELMDRGWSQKTLLRTIVTSATYRQASAVSPALAERDPYNRLFARGPRFRLEAEMIRDGELAASGLLSPKMHGPSVFPAQPDGIWNMPYNEDRWVESEGEDRYRRSLYTFLRRTSPYPMHMTFDATSREFCAARRVRTNTPLQALTLLNDRASFDAARALAARVAGVPDPAGRATLAFRLVVARDPKPAELARILAYVDAERGAVRAAARRGRAGRADAGGGAVRRRRRGVDARRQRAPEPRRNGHEELGGADRVNSQLPIANLASRPSTPSRAGSSSSRPTSGSAAWRWRRCSIRPSPPRPSPNDSGVARWRARSPACITRPRPSGSSTCSWPGRRRSSISSIRSRR